MKITKMSACIGEAVKMMSADGIAPMKGPKNGMMFVMPTIKLTSTAYSMRSSAQPM